MDPLSRTFSCLLGLCLHWEYYKVYYNFASHYYSSLVLKLIDLAVSNGFTKC